jgi:hypothetical protein
VSAIRVAVTLPVLRFGVGPFAVDPLERLLGARVSDLLEPLMTGPMVPRRTEAGLLVDVYPLALPDGEGATLPLGRLGDFGIFNMGGVLVLTVPLAAAPLIAPRLGDALVGRSEPTPSLDGRSRVVRLAIRLPVGSRITLPLGSIGEIGVEAT